MKINDLSHINYEIERDGKNLIVNGKLKHTYFHKGYEVAFIQYKAVPVHRLVALKYISNPDNKPIINHINSNRSDNRVENLEWVTFQENCSHEYKLGKSVSKNRKLKKSEVEKIKELYASGKFSQTKLGEMFGVSNSTISLLIRKKQYKFI